MMLKRFILLFACTFIVYTHEAYPTPLKKIGLIDAFLPRKKVDPTQIGINAFVNDSRFGSISSQFNEVKNTLNIPHIRILFNWDDAVQPTPSSAPNFAFYDSIIEAIPEGATVFAVTTGIPSWMKKKSNWIEGDPRKTWNQLWLQKVAARYKNSSGFIGIQVWNEPNMLANPDNTTMGFAGSPEKYVSFMKEAFTVMRNVSPNLKVISAATTSIIQGYPNALAYNRRMKSAGLEQYCDVWATHIYGKRIENIIRPGGAKSFLTKLSKPLWVTESGAQGTTKQLEYVERYWNFFQKQIKNISRIYLYQFTESSPAATTYGLRNLTAGKTVSDLYVDLRDR